MIVNIANIVAAVFCFAAALYLLHLDRGQLGVCFYLAGLELFLVTFNLVALAV